MKFRRQTLAGKAVVWGMAALLWSSGAFALGPWDRARHKDAQKRADMVTLAEQLLSDAWRSKTRAGRAFNALRAQQLLDGAALRVGNTPKMLFLKAEAMQLQGIDSEAIRLLEQALKKAPNHELALGGYRQLALAYARSGKSKKEIEARTKYLQLQYIPRFRHVAIANRAEAFMLVGKLGKAIADYERAIKLQPGPDGVLARWGLALAQDRTYDFAGAIGSAEKAVSNDVGRWSALDDEVRVFFVEPHDIYWYHALGELARARMISRGTRRLPDALTRLGYVRRGYKKLPGRLPLQSFGKWGQEHSKALARLWELGGFAKPGKVPKHPKRYVSGLHYARAAYLFDKYASAAGKKGKWTALTRAHQRYCVAKLKGAMQGRKGF